MTTARNRTEPPVNRRLGFEAAPKDMDNLFDVAHSDALKLIKIDEDRAFLLAQREPGRRGTIGTVDKVQSKKEKRAAKRSLAFQKLREHSLKEQEIASSSLVLGGSSDEDESEVQEQHRAGPSTQEEVVSCTPAKQSRGTINVVSPSVAAALDRTKTSDRNAAYILTATAQTLGHDISDLALNRSSIKRQREHHRSQMSETLKEEFCADVPLIVHWDGKLMADLTGSDHVDRLPVLVSGNGVSQLLNVARSTGTGEDQARAVVDALKDWNLEDRIVGLSFDTTSSNTGRHSGACVIIEQKLGKDLLHFACRHHILELVAGAAFTTLLGSTSGPEVLLFKRFKKQWEFLDHSKYSTGIDHKDVAQVINPI